jgi:hypothetical protein
VPASNSAWVLLLLVVLAVLLLMAVVATLHAARQPAPSTSVYQQVKRCIGGFTRHLLHACTMDAAFWVQRQQQRDDWPSVALSHGHLVECSSFL